MTSNQEETPLVSHTEQKSVAEGWFRYKRVFNVIVKCMGILCFAVFVVKTYSVFKSTNPPCWNIAHQSLFPEVDLNQRSSRESNLRDKNEMLYLIEEQTEFLIVLTDMLTAANLTWFPCCGTLLGMLRHGGQIPTDYDHDIHVVIQSDEESDRLDQILSKINDNPSYRTSGNWWMAWNYEKEPSKAHTDFFKLIVNQTSQTFGWFDTIYEHNLYPNPPRLDLTFPLDTCSFFGRKFPCPRFPASFIHENQHHKSSYQNLHHGKEEEYGKKAMKCLEERGYPTVLNCPVAELV